MLHRAANPDGDVQVGTNDRTRLSDHALFFNIPALGRGARRADDAAKRRGKIVNQLEVFATPHARAAADDNLRVLQIDARFALNTIENLDREEGVVKRDLFFDRFALAVVVPFQRGENAFAYRRHLRRVIRRDDRR